MLKIISLHTIKQIFDIEALAPLSPMAKMSYISCLMYYFEDMPNDFESTESFNIVKAQIKAYDKTGKYFLEMQAAGLVSINTQTITFINTWQRHIDKALLNRPEPERFFGNLPERPAADFENDLLTNKSLYELISMRNALKTEKITELIKEFVKEKTVTQKKYFTAERCAEHYIYWVNKKHPPTTKSIQKTPGKILGRENY